MWTYQCHDIYWPEHPSKSSSVPAAHQPELVPTPTPAAVSTVTSEPAPEATLIAMPNPPSIVVNIPATLKPTLAQPNEPATETTAPDGEERLEPDNSGGADSDDDDDGHAKEVQIKGFAATKACYAASRPAHIPDGLAVVIVNEKYK
jgi:hypothetical protein